MDESALARFLAAINQEGYAGGEPGSWRREPDGSTTIERAIGEWRLHDNFFGGEPYGGREVVYHAGSPAWLMAYYGAVRAGDDPGPIYAALRQALLVTPDAFPVRGPAAWADDRFVYANTWEGSLGQFTGRESITRDGIEVYAGTYCGGWVACRPGE